MRVTVATGQAVNHDGRQWHGGEHLDVEDRLAAKWIEHRYAVEQTRPARKTTTARKKT